jgi:hypothetical protein
MVFLRRTCAYNRSDTSCRFQGELGFDQQSADQIVSQVFVRASNEEAAPNAPTNTVLREISVLGFERFCELVKSNIRM